MHNEILKSKLAAYSAIASSLLLVGKFVDAQIVYTDISPDLKFFDFNSYSNPDSFRLDLNNDGMFDFKIYALWYSHTYPTFTTNSIDVSAFAYNDNKFAVATATYIDTLDLNDTISVSMNWVEPGLLGYLHAFWDIESSAGSNYDFWSQNKGLWQDVSDKFIGLRLIANGNTFYGWIRLDVELEPSYHKILIKDYAYNTTPNEQILAGDTGGYPLGSSVSSEGEIFEIYPNPANGTITVRFPISKSAEIVVFNFIGEEVMKQAVAAGALSVAVDVSVLAPGTYFIKARNDEGIYTSRFVKQ